MFEEMPHKDIISWNSMIAGYAQHGLANEAIKLFGDMKEQKIMPDAIDPKFILARLYNHLC